MDIVQTVSGYISKMIAAGDGSFGAGSGAAKMKILLLDPDTVSLAPRIWLKLKLIVTEVSIVSTATTQSALLNHEVYLTEYASCSYCYLDSLLMPLG